MRLPLAPLLSDSHWHCSGSVVVHPTATIAPGVWLQADPGCHLQIEAGVSIGAGSVLHSHQGLLLIEVGVTIGSQVLLIGFGTVGSYACIGSQSTLLNPQIAAGQAIAASSLMVESAQPPQSASELPTSETPTPASPAAASARSINFSYSAQSVQASVQSSVSASVPASHLDPSLDASPWDEPSPPSPIGPPSPPIDPVQTNRSPDSAASAPSPAAPNPLPDPSPDPSDAPSPASSPAKNPSVYGLAYLERMMVTMFPHRQAFNGASPPASSPPDPDSNGDRA